MTSIETKYNLLVQSGFPIGNPSNSESTCADGKGHFRHYAGGSIFWNGLAGGPAFVIYGLIRDKWSKLNWERGPMGYPTSDETNAGSGGGSRYNNFQSGTIIWKGGSPEAFAVYGAIYQKWGQMNWDIGSLGLPITDESGTPSIRYNHFVGGSIYWTPAAGSKVVMNGNKIKVWNFLPSTSGFHFANSFAPNPHFTISVFGQPVPIGDASNGLCGGMCYAVRDYHQSGVGIPTYRQAPSTGILYDYMVRRLYDSFNLPSGPVKYLHLMDPSLADLETVPSGGIFQPAHSRAWVMINEEWPRIKADLDTNKPSPLALVLLKSTDPLQLGYNHQVLAYGYSLVGSDLFINYYDPNLPDNDNQVLYANISSPKQATFITTSSHPEINCFFHTDYTLSFPPSQAIIDRPIAVPANTVSIRNDTDANCIVRFYEPIATSFPLALTLWDGTRMIPAGGTVVWTLPANHSQVKATFNGANVQTINAGATFIFNIDDRVKITNQSSKSGITVRIYNSAELIHIRDITLPGGLKPFPIGEVLKYKIPDDVVQVKISFNDTGFKTASRGQSIIYN